MPTYAFRCETCQSEFEAFASIQKKERLETELPALWKLKHRSELSPIASLDQVSVFLRTIKRRSVLLTTEREPMSPTSESSDCCLPRAEGITYLRIGERGITVGMQGLEVIFQQLARLNRQPQDASDEELIGMARRYNYITRKALVEQDYALALRQAYADYLARQSKKMRGESLA